MFIFLCNDVTTFFTSGLSEYLILKGIIEFPVKSAFVGNPNFKLPSIYEWHIQFTMVLV